MHTELSTDVLIIGGTAGGTAAALVLAEKRVPFLVFESTDWLGGQLTAQAVPPDENRWVEEYGCTRRYADLRRMVRAAYLGRPIRDGFRTDPRLNPGGGWVSRLCAEPRIWMQCLHQHLASLLGDPDLKPVHFGFTPVSATADGDRVRSVTFSHADGRTITVTAKYILDASDLGDLYNLAGIEHRIGAEHTSVHGELHGHPDKTDPADQQAVSWCFALEHRPGEDHTIPRPKNYDFWRSYVPQMTPPWAGGERLFSWTVPSHNVEGRRTFRLVPWPDQPDKGELEMWRYRRISMRRLYQDSAADQYPDVTLINMVQMDYWQRPLLGVSPADRAAALAGAREQSLNLIHWMQTEAPRHDSDSKLGYPGLKLRGNELGTADGFAKACYIREPRRLEALTIVHEGHVGTEQRQKAGLNTKALNWEATPFGTGERFPDSVGIGHYMIDLHPSTAGRNNVYVNCAPFRIPMGALIPKRVRNVVCAGKAMGVTHVTNGAYRMHPTEWNAGEAAATLAAWCLAHDLEPHAVHEYADHVRHVQDVLAADGVRFAWPWEV